MPECRFTSTALGALRLAQENAARLGHSYVGSEHLLLGLASQEYSAAARSLQSSGVDSRSLRSAISQLVGTGVPARSLHQGLTPKCCLAIQQAAAASRRLGQNAVSAEHLLLGLLQDRECAACRLMAEQGADLDQLSQGLAAFLGGEELPTRSVRPREPERSTDTRLLDQCARDLTRMAADGQLDPVIGREEELTRVIQILSRRTKNNPALIGEPGVGKTAIVEGLAPPTCWAGVCALWTYAPWWRAPSTGGSSRRSSNTCWRRSAGQATSSSSSMSCTPSWGRGARRGPSTPPTS